MPNPIEHNIKHITNENFINIKDLNVNYKEWYVTGIFYTILHLIEGYLSIYKSKDTINHKERLEYIRKDPVLRKIFNEYKTIYDESLKARYYPKIFSDEDIQEIEECYKEIDTYIKPFVESKLNKYEKQ